MIRLILRGSDEEILGLITRLRLAEAARIVGLIPEGEASRLRFYAEIAGLPLLSAGHTDDWPEAESLVAESKLASLPPKISWMSLPEAEKLCLGSDAEEESERAEKPPVAIKNNPQENAPALSMDLPVFALELRREIRRSRRYHLAFCLSFFQFVDEEGRPCRPGLLLEEPMLSLPRRLGRNTDSWGVSPEGILLHLAPEIMEGGRLLKRRLSRALLDEAAGMSGGPYRVLSAQSLFPLDGDRASELVGKTLANLERLRKRKEGA